MPGGFQFRTGIRHRELRALVTEYGGYHLLDQDTFADAGVNVQTVVIWMTRPVAAPDAEPWVFRSYTGHETPEPVRSPVLSAEAVTAMPVQIWADPWTQTHRVLRYQAQCMRCSWLLWAFDDGDNSPLGALGDCSAWSSYHAATHGMTGPSIGICTGCHTGDNHPASLAQAKTYWHPATQQSDVHIGQQACR